MGTPEPSRSAVVVVDLQNDFLHPNGAYARGGVTSASLAAIPERIAPLLARARTIGVPVVFSQFTLVPGRGGEPLIAEHLAELRPFLRGGDFAPGAWGHETVAELGTADAVIEKVAYSAFAHTRLGWWLGRLGVDHIVVGGIVTNGGVASTVREAHVRDFSVTLLSDGCGAFSDDVHEATLTSLGSVARVVTVQEQLDAWS
jgi:nicotinamidase-related amidase